MIVKLFIIDACTDGLFSGGTAAVALLRHLGQEVFLQGLADELGFPVTVYVLPHQGEFITRSFTPGLGEIGTAHYGYMAAAQAIYSAGLAPLGHPLALHGRGGQFTLFKDDAQPEGPISLRLGPARTSAAPGVDEKLKKHLGLAPEDVLKAEYMGADHLIVACRSMAAMETLDFGRVAEALPRTRLTLSAPLDLPGQHGYAVRAFSLAGALETVPMSLDAHGPLGAFWAYYLKQSRLEVHYISPRTCRAWVERGQDGAISVSGQANGVLRADSAIKELAADDQPAIFGL